MSEVLGKRFKFKWMVKDQGAWCHQMRCAEAAVSNRLCAVHGAWWLSHGQQPPMPDYGQETVDARELLAREAAEAERERQALVALPMRSPHDAEVMRGQLRGAQGLIEQTRVQKRATVKPLVDEARAFHRAYDEVIAAYKACEALALERLDQFTHLHDFEVAKPSKSGIPPRPQARKARESAAPKSIAPKKGKAKKKGRGRA